jgi:hypothetical protein
MKKLIASFIHIRIGKVIAVFLAGILLLVSTACSGDNSLQAKTSDYPTPEVYPPKIYDRNPQNYQDGMNNLSDVDPRADMRDINRKSKQLIKDAERDVIGTNDNYRKNTQQLLDKTVRNPEELKQNIKQGTQEFGKYIKENVRDIGDGTKRGIDNIKENARTAPEELVNRGVETR